ncbi:DUF6165 family protein [Sphingomonas sp. TZW2008]|uniref:DUF6165 family protein n=1 Tax=Sphingomonas sp. TZW2008 TaxID=1917973 RepID=UPI000A26F9E2|nr:DUF6165 family protein [Sphingomonas sp. TZW2008]
MAALASPSVPVSWGELLDKMTILEIKRRRIAQPAAHANVVREYEALRDTAGAALHETAVIDLMASLRSVNEELWEIEDAIRAQEAAARFGSRFVALARSVYRKNDERAAIKRRINLVLESDLVEEKSYWSAN